MKKFNIIMLSIFFSAIVGIACYYVYLTQFQVEFNLENTYFLHNGDEWTVLKFNGTNLIIYAEEKDSGELYLRRSAYRIDGTVYNRDFLGNFWGKSGISMVAATGADSAGFIHADCVESFRISVEELEELRSTSHTRFGQTTDKSWEALQNGEYIDKSDIEEEYDQALSEDRKSPISEKAKKENLELISIASNYYMIGDSICIQQFGENLIPVSGSISYKIQGDMRYMDNLT